jgi:hypothetical protein
MAACIYVNFNQEASNLSSCKDHEGEGSRLLRNDDNFTSQRGVISHKTKAGDTLTSRHVRIVCPRPLTVHHSCENLKYVKKGTHFERHVTKHKTRSAKVRQ